MSAEKKTELKVLEMELRGFGNARLTIYENGDVFISTDGNVHIIKARGVF